MQIQELVVIEKLIVGGDGLAHLPDGKVVMVPQAIPGEEVRVEIVRQKKSYLGGRIGKIITPSPHRISPSCKHFGVCGGCDWQHINYPSQVAIKADILREHVQRARLLSSQDKVAEICQSPLASPRAMHYRQRLRLQVDERGRVGFFRLRSHTVVPVDFCFLARPEINNEIEKINSSPAMAQLLANCRELEITLSPADGNIYINLALLRKPRPTDKKNARIFCTEHNESIIFFSPQDHSRSGPISAADFHDDGPCFVRFNLPAAGGTELQMSYDVGGFCQVNQEQNENLLQTMRGWLVERDRRRALDLFCGMGNFSLPLGADGWEVLGMDLQGASIRSAKRNCENNNLNCVFEKISAAQGIKKLVDNGTKFELVLLDPPRAGCLEVIPYIKSLECADIIYISCNPATLCRDLAALEQQGYKIKKMRLVDMFPQTHHMETIVLLQNSKVKKRKTNLLK